MLALELISRRTMVQSAAAYALHGYSIRAEQWSHEIHVPQTIEGAFAQGAKQMIIVVPDSKTLHNGSMYSSSVTTGHFEQFIARDFSGERWKAAILVRNRRAVSCSTSCTACRNRGWHTFRHSFATLLLANDAAIRVTQDLMRHSTGTLTLDTYAQALGQTNGQRRRKS